ncbi:MAG: flavoprotein [Planctomycetota bacterium]
MTAATIDFDWTNRTVIIGVTGGIACYKMASVVSSLVQVGATVTVLMTESATKFITPATFEALSGRPVLTDIWTPVAAHDPQHISLARDADLMLIAPATMDTIARLAHGHANDIVTLVCSAIDRDSTPVLVAPSMNAVMLAQPATQRNIAQLNADGFSVIEPATGWQACRTDGAGRLPEPEDLVLAMVEALAGE